MITEIAHLTIDPERAEAFEAAVAGVADAFRSAEGCHGMTLERGIEDLASYRLVVLWESVEAHMVDFRQSAAFQTWRDAAGPFFTAAPAVVHTATVERYF